MYTRTDLTWVQRDELYGLRQKEEELKAPVIKEIEQACLDARKHMRRRARMEGVDGPAKQELDERLKQINQKEVDAHEQINVQLLAQVNEILKQVPATRPETRPQSSMSDGGRLRRPCGRLW